MDIVVKTRNLAFELFERAKCFYYDLPAIIKNLFKKAKRNELCQVSLLLFIVSLLILGYSLITRGFTVPFGGDFAIQGMTFIFNGYDDWHYFFKTGIFPQWDTSGFLGASNIGSNSFYYLFDPFFLAMLIFPRSWLLQIQTIMMIVKLVLGGVFFYMLVSEFNVSTNVKKMSAVAYAFSGWTMYYLWFFHFQEIATVFPLMLLGVEKVLKKRDPRMLIFSLSFMALINYFFFFSLTVLTFVYAICRFLQVSKNNDSDTNMAIIGSGFLGFLAGVLISGAILLPCVLVDLDMPRTTSSSYLKDFFALEGIAEKLKYLFTWKETEKYKGTYPLASFLFINDNCFQQSLFSTRGYDNAGSSIYIFMPLALMVLPSLVDACKKKQFSQIIYFIIGVFFLFTPFAYYLLHAFVQAYGRWEIFIVAILILLVATHYDSVIENGRRFVLDISFAILMGLSIYIAYMALFVFPEEYSSLKELLDVQKIVIPCQLAWTTAVYVIIRLRIKKKTFTHDMIYVVALEAILMGNVTIQGQGILQYKNVYGGMADARYENKIVERLNENDPSFFRMFNSMADRDDCNLAMFLGNNGIATFHSVYNFDTKDLIDWSRISYSYGNWSMGVHEKRMNLDTLLGVKYYLLKKDDVNVPYNSVNVCSLDEYDAKLKELLYPYNEESNFALYLNKNFIDTFFVYDKFISSSSFSYSRSENDNEINYLKSAIIDKEELAKEENQAIKSLFVGNKLYNMNNSSCNVKIYRSNWDSQEKGGALRRYSKDMSDAEYILKNPDYDKDIGRYNSPEYGFIYPGDTVSSFNGTVVYHDGYQTEEENNSHSGPANKGLPYFSKIVIEPYNYIEAGSYVSVNFKFGYNVDFYFYDENGEVITHDIHMLNGYDKTYDWKNARGFYTDRKVSKIIGVFKDNLAKTDTTIPSPRVQYQTYEDFDKDISRLALEREKIRVNSRNSDSIDFNTNFEDNKLVVMNIPYQEGWSLKVEVEEEGEVRYQDVNLFKAQGGLLGFIANTDSQHYILSFETPGLKIGLTLTSGGLAISAILFGIYDQKSKFNKMMRQFYKSLSLEIL